MATLTGTETLQIDGQDNRGISCGATFITTTQDIASLAGAPSAAPGIANAVVDQYGFAANVVFSDGQVISSINSTANPSAPLPDFSSNPAAWILPGSLAKGLTGAFLLLGTAAQITTNLAPQLPGTTVSDSTIVGTPTVYPSFTTFNSGNYLQTTVNETADYTILVVARLRDRATNGGVTIGNDLTTDVSVSNDGSTPFGIKTVILQTGTTSLAGTIASAVYYVKPDPTLPVISHIDPSIAATDVTQWRLIAYQANGLTGTITDVTNNVTGSLTAGTPNYRWVNTNPLRIGQDYSNFFNGSVDISAFLYFERALTATEIALFYATYQPFFASKGITV